VTPSPCPLGRELDHGLGEARAEGGPRRWTVARQSFQAGKVALHVAVRRDQRVAAADHGAGLGGRQGAWAGREGIAAFVRDISGGPARGNAIRCPPDAPAAAGASNFSFPRRAKPGQFSVTSMLLRLLSVSLVPRLPDRPAGPSRNGAVRRRADRAFSGLKKPSSTGIVDYLNKTNAKIFGPGYREYSDLKQKPWVQEILRPPIADRRRIVFPVYLRPPVIQYLRGYTKGYAWLPITKDFPHYPGEIYQVDPDEAQNPLDVRAGRPRSIQRSRAMATTSPCATSRAPGTSTRITIRIEDRGEASLRSE